jgi:hypothetical protein
MRHYLYIVADDETDGITSFSYSYRYSYGCSTLVMHLTHCKKGECSLFCF